jgi:hypothetical protein
LRKGLFAVMLVAASFAGGAVVNGPGLRWAQAMILNRADGDGDGPAPGEVLLPPPDASSESIPSAPVSPVVLEPARPASSREKPRGKDGGTAPGKGEAPAPPTPAAAEVAAPAPAPEPKAPPAPEPKTPAPHEPKGQGPGGPAPSGRDVASRAAKPPKDLPPTLDELPPLELPADPPAPKDLDRARRGEPWTASTNAAGDAPDPAPSAAVSPRPFRPADPAPRPPEAAPASTAPANAGPSARTNSTSLGDWAQVRRTMVALGVARYGIEGEPGGRARFYCVIPLAGRHAVGQHFEAEGDDELQAAQVALRRVALWLAAEAPKP